MEGSVGHIMQMLQQKYIVKRLSTRLALICVVPNGVQRTLASTLQLSSWDHFRMDFRSQTCIPDEF
jgi:hypothetical protein